MAEDYKDKTWLNKKYLAEMFPSRKIAELCFVHKSTILRYLHNFNIPLRKSSCLKGRIRPEKEKEKIRKAMKGRNSLEDNPNWKGGKVLADGYVFIRKSGHPHETKRGHYVKESVLIAEKALGRFLKKNEIVHHINLDKSDSKNSNLFVCTRPYHIILHNKIRGRGLISYFKGLQNA